MSAQYFRFWVIINLLFISHSVYAQQISLDNSLIVDSIIVDYDQKYTCSYNSNGRIEYLMLGKDTVEQFFYNEDDILIAKILDSRRSNYDETTKINYYYTVHYFPYTLSSKLIEVYDNLSGQFVKRDSIIYEYSASNMYPELETKKYWDGEQWNDRYRKIMNYYHVRGSYADFESVSISQQDAFIDDQWSFVSSHQYHYDLEAKLLIEITDSNTFNKTCGYYSYDSENRLESKTVMEYGSSLPVSVYFLSRTRYLYDVDDSLISIRFDHDFGYGVKSLLKFSDGFGNHFQFLSNRVDIYYGELKPTNMGTVQRKTVFSVSQNFPNPFNPSTTIEYQVPEKSRVLISVYSLEGQLIKKLVDEEQRKGSYSAVWNGKDSSGEKAASGTYFYQIKYGDAIKTKKMILLK